MENSFTTRAALPVEIDRLAALWNEGWKDAHQAILPEQLRQDRTLESLRRRLEEALDAVRVVGEPEGPAGSFMVKDDELYQLYVARTTRGFGVAAILITDAERHIKNNGANVARLPARSATTVQHASMKNADGAASERWSASSKQRKEFFL